MRGPLTRGPLKIPMMTPTIQQEAPVRRAAGAEERRLGVQGTGSLLWKTSNTRPVSPSDIDDSRGLKGLSKLATNNNKSPPFTGWSNTHFNYIS